jgi:hypothetical protein
MFGRVLVVGRRLYSGAKLAAGGAFTGIVIKFFYHRSQRYENIEQLCLQVVDVEKAIDKVKKWKERDPKLVLFAAYLTLWRQNPSMMKVGFTL